MNISNKTSWLAFLFLQSFLFVAIQKSDIFLFSKQYLWKSFHNFSQDSLYEVKDFQFIPKFCH